MFRRSAVVVVALGLLAACGGGGKKAATTTTTSTTIATTTVPQVVAPLTGLPFADPSFKNRPALVVKIDNADGEGGGNQARPQIGLNQADIVYEEMVEGSVTRLAAVFHSTDALLVGPVRSARTTDVQVFSPLKRPLFAWSGANAVFAQIIRESPLIDVGFDAHSEVYQRRDIHAAPHNLYSSTPDLYSLAPPDAVPPDPLFQYLKPGEKGSASAAPVASIHVEFGGGAGSAPADWFWNPVKNAFDRNQKGTPDVDENGDQVAPQNVIVMFINYVDTGFFDVSGAPVPEGQLVGSGECWVLTNGTLTKGTWEKTSPEAITTFKDASGQVIKLTPGRTWVELPPIGGAVVTG
jgi:hypothetical protein